MKNVFPELTVVSLYYPNNWRLNVSDIVPEEDKRFNWFLCSKKYLDPETNLYVIEVAKGTKFYDESTGDNWVVPLDSSKDTEVTLLLLDSNAGLTRLSPSRVLKLAKSKGYSGIASLKKCDVKNQDRLIMCREAEFGFFDGVLKLSIKEGGCAIINYAKRNYKCIKSMIPTFPSPLEIDEALKEYPLSTVCKILYDDMVKYTGGDTVNS
jgi:hypothetical protein